MSEQAYNLAIETSGRQGSLALGRGDELLAARRLGGTRRHDVGLPAGMAALCEERGVEPAAIGEVYVSLGPGSFTGLRVGVTAAKMLALVHGAKVVGVETIEVLAAGALTDEQAPAVVAVALNLKRGTVYGGVYRRVPGPMEQVGEASLRSVEELLAQAPRPAGLVAEKLPEGIELPQGVHRLGAEASVARAEVLWRLGRERAKRGDWSNPATLLPRYVREPEAVTLWNQRHGA